MSPRDKNLGPVGPAPSPPGLPTEPSPGPVREPVPPVIVRQAGSRDQGRCGPTCRLVSLKDAAVVLGVSTASVRRLIWGRRLPAVRILRRIQLDVRDLERLIEQCKDGRF
jgi:hypothetical protein